MFTIFVLHYRTKLLLISDFQAQHPIFFMRRTQHQHRYSSHGPHRRILGNGLSEHQAFQGHPCCPCSHLTAIMTKQTNWMSIGSQCVSLFILLLFMPFKYSLQFSTLVINYNTSRKLDGRKAGLKPLATSSVLKLMHLWMSKNSLTLLLLPLYVLFKLFLYLC